MKKVLILSASPGRAAIPTCCAAPSPRGRGAVLLPGGAGEKFAVVNAGGGFLYVGAMHDSFPPRAGAE